jgi:hypothetical protein
MCQDHFSIARGKKLLKGIFIAVKNQRGIIKENGVINE